MSEEAFKYVAKATDEIVQSKRWTEMKKASPEFLKGMAVACTLPS